MLGGGVDAATLVAAFTKPEPRRLTRHAARWALPNAAAAGFCLAAALRVENAQRRQPNGILLLLYKLVNTVWFVKTFLL